MKLRLLATKDRVGALLLLTFCLGYGLLSRNIAQLPERSDVIFNARSMPTFLAIVGCVLALTLIFRPSSDKPANLRDVRWLRLTGFLMLMALFGIAIRPLGFVLATSGFLAISFGLLGERNLIRLIGIPIVVAVGFWAIMDLALGVYVNPLPELMAS